MILKSKKIKIYPFLVAYALPIIVITLFALTLGSLITDKHAYQLIINPTISFVTGLIYFNFFADRINKKIERYIMSKELRVTIPYISWIGQEEQLTLLRFKHVATIKDMLTLSMYGMRDEMPQAAALMFQIFERAFENPEKFEAFQECETVATLEDVFAAWAEDASEKDNNVF